MVLESDAVKAGLQVTLSSQLPGHSPICMNFSYYYTGDVTAMIGVEESRLDRWDPTLSRGLT